MTLCVGCTMPPTVHVRLLATQTCERLGACQGASMHDGFVYLYGDANPGVIRQYVVRAAEVAPPTLEYTGVEIALTRNGKNVINHSTGLTWNTQFGTYLGNSMTATKKAAIYHLDWPRMLIDRNLDHAVLNVIDDDLAVQGCRPEFVRRGERWLLATADYGSVHNAVRYYDPTRLPSARKTSEFGVLVARFPCSPWVQNLHWVDEQQRLLLILNKTEGRGWRLAVVDPWNTADYRTAEKYDDLANEDELEGFSRLSAGECVLVTSSEEENVSVGVMELR